MEPAPKRSKKGVGGVKLPMRLSLSVWGRRADLAMRVRVLLACYKQRRNEADQLYRARARKQALEREEGQLQPHEATGLQEFARGLFGFREVAPLRHFVELAKHDLDVEEDMWGPLIVTPIRNPLHIAALRIEGLLSKHPWARFLEWYLLNYGSSTAQQSVFGEQQYLQTERVHVRLLRGPAQQGDEPTVLLWRPEGGGETEEFYLYTTPEPELARLQDRVQQALLMRNEKNEPHFGVGPSLSGRFLLS